MAIAGPDGQPLHQDAIGATPIFLGLEQVLGQGVRPFVSKVGPGLDRRVVAVEVRDELHLTAV